jgi:hypothetical protein
MHGFHINHRSYSAKGRGHRTLGLQEVPFVVATFSPGRWAAERQSGSRGQMLALHVWNFGQSLDLISYYRSAI